MLNDVVLGEVTILSGVVFGKVAILIQTSWDKGMGPCRGDDVVGTLWGGLHGCRLAVAPEVHEKELPRRERLRAGVTLRGCQPQVKGRCKDVGRTRNEFVGCEDAYFQRT
jgi:hypothetical protein